LQNSSKRKTHAFAVWRSKVLLTQSASPRLVIMVELVATESTNVSIDAALEINSALVDFKSDIEDVIRKRIKYNEIDL
jgi:hypothetical protein